MAGKGGRVRECQGEDGRREGWRVKWEELRLMRGTGDLSRSGGRIVGRRHIIFFLGDVDAWDAVIVVWILPSRPSAGKSWRPGEARWKGGRGGAVDDPYVHLRQKFGVRVFKL